MAAAGLHTDYLGKQLGSPLVAAPSPLTLRLDNLRRLEAAGAGAVVLGSLFEERIRGGCRGIDRTRLPGPDEYLELVAGAKAALSIPVVASLNAGAIGAWVHHAAALQQAGADAIELDLALSAADPDVSSARIERDYLDVVASVRLHTTLPLAVKVPPAFTSLPSVLVAMRRAGAAGAVLFHRPCAPDLDLGTRQLVPRSPLSEPRELGHALRWLVLLRGRVGLDLAAAGGVHSGADALKAVVAGANVAMVCSALLRHGIGRLAEMQRELATALGALGVASLAEVRGSARLPPGVDPALLERAHYFAVPGA
jgi:dihydroorotate dehydrogenase (fumarate)